MFRVFFITARKRSLGQGNIFIGVCQEFCSRGGVLPGARWGMSAPGGGVCSGGAWWRPQTAPRRILLRAVRILLERILVVTLDSDVLNDKNIFLSI